MPKTELQSLLEVVDQLAPRIRSCADEIEATRELPRPLFEALADAGLFHLALPRTLGCPEIDLPSYIQVIEALGKADASTAWTINQGGIFATYAARMPPDVARTIWIDTPRGVVSNTPAPTAKAIVVPGGYRVTGEQGFSTGCRHASWVAPHAQIIENDRPRLLDNDQPESRYLFVPVDDVELLDTWHVRGPCVALGRTTLPCVTSLCRRRVACWLTPRHWSRRALCTRSPARCCSPRVMRRSPWAWPTAV